MCKGFYLFSLMVILLGASCAQRQHADQETPLPFVVYVGDVTWVAAGDADASVSEATDAAAAVTPADFGNQAGFRQRLAIALDRAEIFTSVTTTDDPPADLRVDFEISGRDFGPSRPQFGSAVFSTIVWLTAGHLSWLIADREFPESNVILTMRIGQSTTGLETAESEQRKNLFHEDLLVKGLDLNLLERSGMKGWLLNTLLPPWWGSGDPKRAGISLGRKAVDFFATEAPPRILGKLPALHHRELHSFLGYDAEGDELLIVSRDRVRKLVLDAAGHEVVSLPPEDVELFEIHDAATQEMRLFFSQRGLSVGAGDFDRYYRIPLPRDFAGFIRIHATLEETTGRWTIFREPGRVAAYADRAMPPPSFVSQ